VAPPNEWPTIATLFKSNLPLKGKPVQLVTGVGGSNILNALEKRDSKIHNNDDFLYTPTPNKNKQTNQ